MRPPVFLVFALLATAVSAVQAQDMPVMFDGLAGQMAMTDLLFDNTTERIAAPAAGKSKPVAATRFAYAPTAALRASTVQGYVTRLKAQNPAAAQAVAASLGPGKHDYGRIYHGIVQGAGLRDNNAVDNLAAYLVLGWMITHNKPAVSELPAGAPRGLSAQLAPRLAANTRLTAPGAAATLGEEMKLLVVVVQGGWQAAVKEGKLPAYQQGVARMFKQQYGIDLRAVRLTGQGLAKK